MKKVSIIVFALIVIGVITGVILSSMKSNTAGTASSPALSTTNSSSTASSSNTSASSSNNKTYSASEVSQHDSRSDCWLIISNKVYDVTQFLGQHPGGSSQITPYCGKEATQAFATQGGEGSHSSRADAMLANYLIGALK